MLTVPANGTVHLTEADLAELSVEPQSFTSDGVGTSGEKVKKRIIKDNKALKKAFMLNVPVVGEEDIWDHIDEVEISNNFADDEATMINYPTSKDIVMAGIKRHS